MLQPGSPICATCSETQKGPLFPVGFPTAGRTLVHSSKVVYEEPALTCLQFTITSISGKCKSHFSPQAKKKIIEYQFDIFAA